MLNNFANSSYQIPENMGKFRTMLITAQQKLATHCIEHFSLIFD